MTNIEIIDTLQDAIEALQTVYDAGDAVQLIEKAIMELNANEIALEVANDQS